MDEAVLLESASLRRELCTDDNTAILERVGTLITLPESGFATTEQVAEFYRVSATAVKNIVQRHQDELEMDGYKSLSSKEFRETQLASLKSKARMIAIFPRRAILRVGMLLVESEIAKQVRHYLLAVESHSLTVSDRQSLLEMAEQLQTQSARIAENARISSENARISSENARQLISQANIIKAMVQDMYRDREEVRKVRDKVDKLELRFSLRDSQPQALEEECITDRQIEILRETVRRMPGLSITIWKKFNKRFGITRYKFLPTAHFDEALAWLDRYGETNRPRENHQED